MWLDDEKIVFKDNFQKKVVFKFQKEILNVLILTVLILIQLKLSTNNFQKKVLIGRSRRRDNDFQKKLLIAGVKWHR